MDKQHPPNPVWSPGFRGHLQLGRYDLLCSWCGDWGVGGVIPIVISNEVRGEIYTQVGVAYV